MRKKLLAGVYVSVCVGNVKRMSREIPLVYTQSVPSRLRTICIGLNFGASRRFPKPGFGCFAVSPLAGHTQHNS